jgi:hypothetical protein
MDRATAAFWNGVSRIIPIPRWEGRCESETMLHTTVVSKYKGHFAKNKPNNRMLRIISP